VQQLARYLQTTGAKPLQPGQTLDDPGGHQACR
jgi:hypothetical protein